ncbi:MAG: succinate--CoA ligase subunit alpha [Proteobacteria bacterium]|nr:succinate--CoA ligase subunit alpha [Pseudomonadota bacterium]
MAILCDRDTKLLVQGLGKMGRFHAGLSRAYHTQVVGGVAPGKGGTEVDGMPVFDTMREAVAATGANASVVFVPPPGAADAILEAADAGIELVVCITEGIPVLDMLRAKRGMRGGKTRLLGPNCPGVVTPGQCRIGIMPAQITKPGPVGVISRSGTLTYEAVGQLTELGLGQSSAVGIGGDPVNGLKHIDVMRMFNDDPETDAVVMIGEIGGTDEEAAALWIKDNMKKPVVGFIAGVTAPPGKRMGHAGAIISGGKGTAQEKLEVMAACGIKVTKNPSEMGALLKAAI